MWVKIYCTCGKLLAEAKPGSVVKKHCKCGKENVVEVKIPFADKRPDIIK